ncbi:MAG: hypothetical protein K0Q56_1582 [Sporolactobacillus laevolacticus]|jgi:hypothetical protein|nr:hypothetical protein [Sporolactobacillus laevolacticus]
MKCDWIDDYCLAKKGAEMDYKEEWHEAFFLTFSR